MARAGRASGSGSSGPSGGSAQTTWVGAGSQQGNTLGNGIPYTPIGKGDTFEFDFISAISGTQNIELVFFMSAAQSANINLRVDYASIADGESPSDVTLTTQTAFVHSVSANTNKARITSENSQTLDIPVNEGDYVYVKVTRLDSGSDTHNGDMNLLGVRLP